MTYPQLAEMYGVTENRIYAIMRSARQLVTELEVELLKTIHTDDVIAFCVPYGPDRSLAMQFYEWLRGELRWRGVKVKEEHRVTKDGSVFFLSDVTYSRESREIHNRFGRYGGRRPTTEPKLDTPDDPADGGNE
jgi:hypothetical protein